MEKPKSGGVYVRDAKTGDLKKAGANATAPKPVAGTKVPRTKSQLSTTPEVSQGKKGK